ncbi:MAG TPA: ferric iron uptake transcriptional regulator [Gammaproteobacteria bacterium]|nr:ferric iron uptake transcriptional regulator [Gammaproteobacteria bacterium]
MPVESADLKKAGLKVTLPRMKILQFLENSKQKHMSAEEVYKALLETGEDIGLATVYRVLTQFETAGLITRHHFEGGHSVFELDEGGHHDHIVCENCGRIEEFYDDVIEQRQTEIAKKHGFTITSHAMILYGRCQRKDCQKGK